MFVKPKEGVNVRDPITKLHIPASGAEVPENTYWVRRVESGDVIRTDSPHAAAAERIISKKQSTK